MTDMTPEIRFSEFNDDWDKGLLSRYLTASKLKNKEKTFGKEDVLSVSREYGVVNQIEYQGRSFAGESLVGYGVAGTSDVVYTKSPLRDQPYGIIKTNKGVPGIVSALYAIYHPTEEAHPDFIQTYFEKDKRLNDYLRPIVHKGAKNTLNISDDGALLGDIIFPGKSEQIKIADFISFVDECISLQRDECERIQCLKESLLENLFPVGQRTVPNIRLNGFSDEWIVRPLSSFLEISKEKNKDMSLTECDVLSVSQYQGVVNQIEFQGKSLAGSSLKGYKILDINQIVYTKSPLKQQPFGIIKVNKYKRGIVSSLYAVYTCKNADGRFIEFYFSESSRLNKYLRVLVRKGAKNTMNISDEGAISGNVIFPSYEEQVAIADLLTWYDELIKLHKQKLEKLNNLKQALLDKMFV